MLAEELGEFGLIERIRQNSRLSLSPYDDAAIIPLKEEKLLLVATDMLVENVHFSLDFINPYEIGWRAMASNLSDIAAMGGVPTHFLVSLCIKPNTKVDFVDDLYRGMEELGAQFGLGLAGGDINRGERFIINLTVVGEVEKGSVVRRDGARCGDKIVVTGSLGEAECGLSILKKGCSGMDKIIKKHTMPSPRVKEARAIISTCKISAMIDISDGLVADLYHIVEASGVGANIYLEKLPLSQDLKRQAKLLSLDPVELALYGGEDYELLFTAKELTSIPQLEVPLTVIGEIIQEKGLFLIYNGKKEKIFPKGYRHF
jgi:thiamine-monophosphate kinase